MLPKKKIGAELLNLNVVVGSEHKQGAQNRKQLT
jgi:ribosomal protein L13